MSGDWNEQLERRAEGLVPGYIGADDQTAPASAITGTLEQIVTGLAADRPAATAYRGWYFSSDTATLAHSDGVTWAAVGGAAGGGLTLIASQTLPGDVASVDFSTIPGTYKELRLSIVARSTRVNSVDNLVMEFNGDTAAHYNTEEVDGDAATATAFGTTGGTGSACAVIPAASAAAGVAGSIVIDIPSYANTVWNKPFSVVSGALGAHQMTVTGIWLSTVAINRVHFRSANGANIVSGSIFNLYGIS